jgi:hypothetical protein
MDRDSHIGLVARERPSVWSEESRIADAIVASEFVRRPRRSASLWVSGTGAHDAVDRADAQRNEVAVGELTIAQRYIDLFLE